MAQPRQKSPFKFSPQARKMMKRLRELSPQTPLTTRQEVIDKVQKLLDNINRRKDQDPQN
jgi:hypothetical protein